jgi:signal transduction histidine kinase/ligand-binding sensor domain-containing protein/DNA-binding response OmpR family regulator
MLKRFVCGNSWSVLVLLLLVLQSAFGQKSLNFTKLTTKNGLSANTVNVILQDSNGLMWFGTGDGLNKFDGTNFTVYNHDIRDSTSIPGNEVTALLQDRSGKIWLGTNAGGVVYYDPRQDAFVAFKGDGSWPDYKSALITSLCEDHLGNIWMGSYSSLKIVNPRTGKITQIDVQQLNPRKLNLFLIESLFEDKKHRMWIGTNDGLVLYNPQRATFERFAHQDAGPGNLSDNTIKFITQDSDGRLFFGTANGLNMLQPDEKSFRVFHHSDKEPTSITSDLIYSMVPAPGGKLWVGTEEGLNILDCKTYTFNSIQPNRRNVFGLSNKSVRSICIARKGITWIGTYQGGVNKYDPNLALFNLEHGAPFDPNGLSSSIVTSFADYKKGAGVFVGTDGGGLHFFNRTTGLFKHLEINSSIHRAGNPLSILALEMDSDNKLWIGTFQNGLFLYNPQTDQYKQYLAGPVPYNLNMNDVFCIKQDSKGLIWIGTNGEGVNVFNPKDQTFTRYGNHARSKYELSLPINGYLRAIAEDKNGDMWLGSYGTGLAIYHRADHSFTHYDKGNSKLSDNVVLSIFHDRTGNTWVGTNGGGLNFFDKKTRQFTQINETNGLLNDFVYKILEDDSGLIWVSTDKGISSIDPKTKKIRSFTKHNGVQDSPFIVGSGMKSSTGELYFGGQDGFNYFLPSALSASNDMPSVLLTDLKVSNRTVLPGENSPIQEQIGFAKDVRLAYGQNFSISYVALNYTAPQQNRYSYKLSGFDPDWNFVSTVKTAYYTNLDPGDYVFQVRTNNMEGKWNERPTTIHIHVLPPIWRTKLAYFIYVVLALGLLWYIRHRGIRKIKLGLALEQEKINARQQVEQERREGERVHELDSLKIKFLTNLSHEFRTPISLLLAPADKLLSLQNDPAISNQVKMIRRNARRLLNLVNQLLDFRKMEEQELKLNLSDGDIISFVQEAAESFQDLSERKKISLIVESDAQHLATVFDHDKIERIIFNLLSNAFKFTSEGGAIRLKMSVGENDTPDMVTFCLSISDTGVGIAPELKDQIFERFFQDNSTVFVLNQGSGIGLSITKEFVQLHGGEITVESEAGMGSTFFLKLPLIVKSEPIAGTDQEFEHPDQQPVAEPNGEDEAVLKNQMATILLVEDNEEFRFYLKDSLQAYYHIVEAANGKEGWQKALAIHPQLVVSDISMPYMNGIELSHKIKSDKRTSHIPVILLTAINGEENQITGLESGANDYLTKPFNFEILNTKIKNLLLYNRSLKDAYSRQIHVVGKEIEIESSDAKLLNNIVKYIDEKLNDPELSVEDLSKHVGMSRGSLYHKLLEMTGVTPIEYIRSVKLDRAATFLEKSDYNVAQIAYMTGFGTPSYFSRLFKAKYSVLPSEYINFKRKDAKTRAETAAQ